MTTIVQCVAVTCTCESSVIFVGTVHVSPAWSLWEQSVWFFREWGQSHRWISFPLHSTLFIHTTPSPAPKTEFPSALSASPQPSCLQTTWASLMSHRSAQTEPHTACPTDQHRLNPTQRYDTPPASQSTGPNLHSVWEDGVLNYT